MSKEILQDIINNFQTEKFSKFFRDKNREFTRKTENLREYNDLKFTDCEKLGEIKFENDNVIFICLKSKDELTERSSKKLQYEKAKKILKEQTADAGIFIFYDTDGSFRFSLVYASYTGKRSWSNFKRFSYFVNKNLTNKTFLQRIGSFSFESLEKIKEAFSVDKVTKEFYKDIANWYFWAVDNSKFPDSAEEIDNGRNIAVIRLITRLIFIWFMKELRLIPNNLFDEKNISEMLKDTSEKESSFYKAILQNLFFATLSTPKEQRQFADETRHNKGHNEDFGNQNVFRYHELYNNPENIKSYFDEIPFLNGGLFECLDKGNENYYIDGFTRRKQYQPKVPNYLFFSQEHKEDLSKWYGTKNKEYNVKGLIEILSSYNFTVDENTPDDADVALDPELLGKVFENLLASFNPETSTTARKATGSFYTPREIVDYMVSESLKEYFKTHLSDVESIDEKIESLFNPINTENPFIDNSKDTRKLVSLIENLKIVDPAVGSGAFPMGILNKLVFILNKIDKGNKLWKEAQLKSVENIQDSRLREETRNHIENYFKNKNPDYGRKLYLIQRCIYGVDIQQIAVEIAKLRFFISLLVDEKIDKTKPNWGIEPLPNLDFKIMQGNSLLEEYEGIKLFDEKLFEDIDDNKINQLNILKRKQNALQKEILKLFKDNKYTSEIKKEYLKKLEDVSKKIDSLIYGNKTKDNMFDIFDVNKETNEKRDNLTKLHREFFEVSKKEEKDKIRKEIDKLEWELIEATLISQGKKSKLDELDKIRKSNSKPFFLWKLHFADVFEKGGFDIVIGNPPYIQLQKDGGNLANIYKNCNFATFERTGDIYALFYEKGINLLKQNGHLCFITSNKWMRAGYGESLREFFVSQNPKLLIDLGPGVFENATVDVNILIIQKSQNNNLVQGITLSSDAKENNFNKYILDNLFLLPKLSNKSWYIGSSAEQSLKEKIERNGKPLKDWDVNIYRGILTGLNEAFIIDNKTKENLCKEDPKSIDIIKPLLRGKDIGRFHCNWKGLWLISSGYEIDVPKHYPAVYKHLLSYQHKAKKREDQGKNWWNLRSCTYYQEFKKEKVIYPETTNNANFYFDDGGIFFAEKTTFILTGNYLRYLTGVLSSKLSAYTYKKFYTGVELATKGFQYNKHAIEKYPIPPIIPANMNLIGIIEKLVMEIIKKRKDKIDISNEENKIDQLVYKLYDLSDEEIKIIENAQMKN